MNTLLIIVALLCLLVGIAGSVLPGLPGPPVSWVGLLLLSFCDSVAVSTGIIIGAALLAAFITVLDYVVPGAFTKRFGGGRAGVWGCNIGLVVSIIGLPFGPQGLLGVILWPFLGALAGELLSRKDFGSAAKAALGAFLGFLTGTFVKLVYSVAAAIYAVEALIHG